MRIHYRRSDGDYGDWGLHLWQVNDAGQYIADYPGVSWGAPLPRSGIDAYGAYFDLPAAAFTHPAAAGFGFIVHPPNQGGDPGVDRIWKFSDGGEFWLLSGDATVYRNDPLGPHARYRDRTRALQAFRSTVQPLGPASVAEQRHRHLAIERADPGSMGQSGRFGLDARIRDGQRRDRVRSAGTQSARRRQPARGRIRSAWYARESERRCR
ncbi:MAG: hypothetical protein E6Q88_12505 [Lysobacteraceae bacterium]|nr:MAG: hypothetical protein E6Q88_12505 [Xanthomonadaceae bacterium]